MYNAPNLIRQYHLNKKIDCIAKHMLVTSSYSRDSSLRNINEMYKRYYAGAVCSITVLNWTWIDLKN